MPPSKAQHFDFAVSDAWKSDLNSLHAETEYQRNCKVLSLYFHLTFSAG